MPQIPRITIVERSIAVERPIAVEARVSDPNRPDAAPGRGRRRPSCPWVLWERGEISTNCD